MGSTPSRGKRLLALREAFGDQLTQQIVADLGELNRVDVSKCENDDTEWKSYRLLKGLGKAYGMTAEQIETYLDGYMLIEDALALARPIISKALEKAAGRTDRYTTITKAYQAAAKKMDVPVSVKAFVEEYWQVYGGMTTTELVAQMLVLAKVLHEQLDEVSSEFGSESDSVPIKQ